MAVSLTLACIHLRQNTRVSFVEMAGHANEADVMAKQTMRISMNYLVQWLSGFSGIDRMMNLLTIMSIRG